MVDINKKFGRRVRELRKAKGWTQEQLAEKTGISTRSISSIENGVYSITLENINRLAKAFGLSLKDLFNAQRNRTALECQRESRSEFTLWLGRSPRKLPHTFRR